MPRSKRIETAFELKKAVSTKEMAEAQSAMTTHEADANARAVMFEAELNACETTKQAAVEAK